MTEQDALELARDEYRRYWHGTQLMSDQFRALAQAELAGDEPTPYDWVAAARKVYDKEVAKLLGGEWFQVSRRYRIVARLPEGKTGIEALSEASGRPEWAAGLRETNAGDQFLRVYATDTRTLDRPTFAAFRKAGGGTYSRRA
jgi:hypothetical protein